MGDKTELPVPAPQQMASAAGHDSHINNGARTSTASRFFRLNFFNDGAGHLLLSQTEGEGYIHVLLNITTGPLHMAQPSYQSPDHNAPVIQEYHASMVNLQVVVQAYHGQHGVISSSNENGPPPRYEVGSSPFDAAFAAAIPYRAPIVITNVCKDCGAVA
ncbi:hypothetical protein N0V85_008368 [Neurospora sp. IMI 360204]|nr:hypothetical protein N0V85_008368 [Neurospora sp. IMI 360204]